MQIETCIKYLTFVSQECNRYLENREISDDELIRLIVEFERFQENVKSSDLPEEIKTQIAALKLNYSINSVKRSGFFLIAAMFSFGAWAILLSMRKQAKRKEALAELSNATSSLASDLKLRYS